MKKLLFTKKTISNLNTVTGGAAGSEPTNWCESQEDCTYSALPNCPKTSSRATEAASKKPKG